ncbi:MAG: hypothetical protein EZS28_021971, partial [Streblomastix strix]
EDICVQQHNLLNCHSDTGRNPIIPDLATSLIILENNNEDQSEDDNDNEDSY